MRDSITQSYDEIYNDEAEAQLSIFGNEEWAIRIFSPIIHFLTSIILLKLEI